MKKGNGNFILIVLIVAVLLVFLFPKINDFVTKLSMPKVPKDKEVKKEVKKVDSTILDNLSYPIMRNSVYDSKTYYSLDSFSVSDLSNQDILYNAFMDLYEGNIVNGQSAGSCTSQAKEFSSKYMTFRIKNILGKNVNYSFGDFYVPTDADSHFPGNWKYDAGRGVFKYEGDCNPKSGSTKYYDLKEFIKAEYDEYDIIVYSYVGFAKVEGVNYTIYSDAAMKNEILSGSGDVENLEEIFKGLKDTDKKVYKYTFKDTLCSYGDYCLYKGEWTNEL